MPVRRCEFANAFFYGHACFFQTPKPRTLISSHRVSRCAWLGGTPGVQQCEETGDCCPDYKQTCVAGTIPADDWSGPPTGTLVPLQCDIGEVTVAGECVPYTWDLAQDAEYHQLVEPLAETAGAVVGDEYIVFGDGAYLGSAGTSETTKKTFVYNFKTRDWDSERARRPHWGDHQSVEVGHPWSDEVSLPPSLLIRACKQARRPAYNNVLSEHDSSWCCRAW